MGRKKNVIRLIKYVAFSITVLLNSQIAKYVNEIMDRFYYKNNFDCLSFFIFAYIFQCTYQ